MSTTPSRTALHPMLWVAAASVTAFSLAGVAKLTGLLPESGTAAPQTSAVTGAVAPEPVAPTRSGGHHSSSPRFTETKRRADPGLICNFASRQVAAGHLPNVARNGLDQRT